MEAGAEPLALDTRGDRTAHWHRGTENPKHFVLVLPNLGLGGAQRQMLLLAEELREQGLRVTIVLVSVLSLRRESHYRTQDFPVRLAIGESSLAMRLTLLLGAAIKNFPGGQLVVQRLSGFLTRFFLRSGFRVANLTQAQVEWLVANPSHLPSVVGLSKILKELKPNTVISFLPNTNFVMLLAANGLDPRPENMIVVERNDVCRQPFPPAVNRYRKEMYPLATRTYANSLHATSDLAKLLGPSNVGWLPNLSVKDLIRRDSRLSKVIAVVGRLHSQKRIDIVLRCFAESRISEDGWALHIVGDGPEKSTLKKLVIEMQMESYVQFIPAVSEWWSLENPADAIVIASDYEGFPNILTEAAATGVLALVRHTVEGAMSALGPDLENEIVFWNDSELVLLMRRLADDPDWVAESVAEFTRAIEVFQLRSRAVFIEELERITNSSNLASKAENSNLGQNKDYPSTERTT